MIAFAAGSLQQFLDNDFYRASARFWMGLYFFVDIGDEPFVTGQVRVTIFVCIGVFAHMLRQKKF